jgi:hypothetical protein
LPCSIDSIFQSVASKVSCAILLLLPSYPSV